MNKQVMKNALNFVDALFAIWLFLASAFAVLRGGFGLDAWPLILLSGTMLLIASRRANKIGEHYLASVTCYATSLVLCVHSVVNEYQYTRKIDIELEIWGIAGVSADLLAWNLIFWLKRGARRIAGKVA